MMVRLYIVSCKERLFTGEARWHRGKVEFSSLAEQKYSAGDFFCAHKQANEEGEAFRVCLCTPADKKGAEHEIESDIGGM